jgi:mandelate racemase
MFEKLTLRSIDVRAVLVPLQRPVVSKVGLFSDWPLILIDLYTNEGVVGRSYLEPYLKNAARTSCPPFRIWPLHRPEKRWRRWTAFRAIDAL